MLMTKCTRGDEGFTLIEALLYIGLFGIILTGTIASVYPIFTNTQRSTDQVVIEGEAAFITRKIDSSLLSATAVFVPFAQDELRVTMHGGEVAWFRQGTDEIEISRDSGTTWTPLNAERTTATGFFVSHVLPVGDAPRYVEYTFDVDGNTVGPVRKIFHF